eukprot:1191954-Prorocentrum_minimum.AAC.5
MRTNTSPNATLAGVIFAYREVASTSGGGVSLSTEWPAQLAASTVGCASRCQATARATDPTAAPTPHKQPPSATRAKGQARDLSSIIKQPEATSYPTFTFPT